MAFDGLSNEKKDVQDVIAERAPALTDSGPAREAADAGRRAALQERRVNDPSSLTDEERAELARLEELAGVEERRGEAR